MARRKRGRPKRLMEPGVHEKLVNATKGGAPIELAAQYAGVSPLAFQVWMQRGREELEAREDGATPDAGEQIYVDLWDEIVEARAAAGVSAVAVIRKVMHGGAVTEESTKRYRDPTTGEMVEETTVKRTPPDWRAASWYLERQQSAHFSKAAEKLELSGAVGGQVALTEQAAADLTARIQGNIKALTEAAKPPETEYPVVKEEDTVDAEVVTD